MLASVNSESSPEYSALIKECIGGEGFKASTTDVVGKQACNSSPVITEFTTINPSEG
jgi:hypothetical protein